MTETKEQYEDSDKTVEYEHAQTAALSAAPPVSKSKKTKPSESKTGKQLIKGKATTTSGGPRRNNKRSPTCYHLT